MNGRRFVVLVGAAALVAPLTGWTSLPAAASGTSGSAPAAVSASMCFPSTDNGDPMLKTFGFSPRKVDSRRGSQTVTFTATAEDAGGPGAPSGVAGATVYVSFDDTGNWNLSAPIKPDGNGALVGTLTILPQFRTATRYVPLSVDDVDGTSTLYTTGDLDQMGLLTDVVEGYRLYGPKKLAAIGQPGLVRIVSRKDPEPPTVRLRSVTPNSVDLRTGAQSVTVVVRVKDRVSGARRVALTLDGPESGNGESSTNARLVRVSGTARDGVWKATVTLRPCGAVSGPWRATVFAWDAAGGDYLGLPKALTVLNADIQRPTAAVVGDYSQVRRAGPPTVEFAEDVVGVDAENTLVHVGDSQRGRADDNPAPIAGTWACKDAAGAAVDCSTGPVRTAAFTPTAPMIPGRNHTLVLNPEHHLGLTDLAGNPYAPTSAVNFHTI